MLQEFDSISCFVGEDQWSSRTARKPQVYWRQCAATYIIGSNYNSFWITYIMVVVLKIPQANFESDGVWDSPVQEKGAECSAVSVFATSHLILTCREILRTTSSCTMCQVSRLYSLGVVSVEDVELPTRL